LQVTRLRYIGVVTVDVVNMPYSRETSNDISINNKNSSGDEIANVNFLYDDIVHVLYKIQYDRA